MRNDFLLVFFLTATIASCSSEIATDGGGIIIPEEHRAVSFKAYALRSSRSASTNNIATTEDLAQVGGFGVFAYEESDLHFMEYSLTATHPNFFNNQQVWEHRLDDTSTYPNHKGEYDYTDDPEPRSWVYSPIRYYSNNIGALHSFFAYAPYTNDVMMIYESGRAPQIMYNVAQNTDLLWAKPVLDKPKAAVDEDIPFDFRHALSKVTFHVAPFIDKIHPEDGEHNEGTSPGPGNPITVPLAKDVTVKIESIRFVGLIPSNARLNLMNGEWLIDNTLDNLKLPNASTATWTGDGTTKQPYHKYNAILPIPSENLRIEIIFNVIWDNGNGRQQLLYQAKSQEYFKLEGGNAYDFFLDLGLNSIKFSAVSSDWDSTDVDINTAQNILWVENINWIRRIQEVEF